MKETSDHALSMGCEEETGEEVGEQSDKKKQGSSSDNGNSSTFGVESRDDTVIEPDPDGALSDVVEESTRIDAMKECIPCVPSTVSVPFSDAPADPETCRPQLSSVITLRVPGIDCHCWYVAVSHGLQQPHFHTKEG